MLCIGTKGQKKILYFKYVISENVVFPQFFQLYCTPAKNSGVQILLHP
jgi:hypothetical protein